MRDRYGRNTFGQSCLLARRLIEAGTRVVEVIWPKVANSDNHSWDHHADLTKRMKDQSAPMLDQGLGSIHRGHGRTRLAQRNARRRHRRIRPQPAKRREHFRQSRTAPTAAIIGRIATPRSSPAPASSAAMSTANRTKPAAARRDPVHPTELLATIYHAFGIDPETIVYNHLKQPRELVKAKAVTKLFA